MEREGKPIEDMGQQMTHTVAFYRTRFAVWNTLLGTRSSGPDVAPDGKARTLETSCT